MRAAGKCSCAHNQPALDALARLAQQCASSGKNKFRFAVLRAMKSLQAYPLPIASEREAMQLEGVGNFMANEIMKALRHHAAAAAQAEDAENVAAPANGVRGVRRADSCDGVVVGEAEEDDGAGVVSLSQLSQASEFAGLSQQTEQVGMELSQSRPAPRPSKEYVPEAGRGPWILLVTLYIAGGSGTRLEILQQASAVETSALVKTTLAASWASSIRILMSKDLVHKAAGTIYSLTETGHAAAQSAHEAYLAAMRESPQELSDDEDEYASQGSMRATDDILQLDLTQQSTESLSVEASAMSVRVNLERRQLTRAATYPGSATRTSTESARFLGGSPSDWTVVLLIDHREEDAELIQTSMLCQGFACETAQLAVGDFLWVARHKTQSSEQVVLDIVLERKTVNDLAASIIDGRYNEQKLRLKQAAIPTSAYIIEGNLSAQDRMDPASLRTAMTTTEVIHGLRVIPTRNIDHSIRVIQSLFEQQVRAWPQTFDALTSGRRAPVSFADFQKKFVKRSAQTVGDVFRAQLRQIPNCSAARASVLNRQFETMRQMLQHLERLPDRRAVEHSLAALQSDQRTRPIGPALAKFIARLYLDEF